MDKQKVEHIKNQTDMLVEHIKNPTDMLTIN
jgi:hypothetical protein